MGFLTGSRLGGGGNNCKIYLRDNWQILNKDQVLELLLCYRNYCLKYDKSIVVITKFPNFLKMHAKEFRSEVWYYPSFILKLFSKDE